MWRRLAIVLAPSTVAILTIGIGSFVADVHRHQAAQQAYQASVAQHQERLAEQTEVRTELAMLELRAERDQALAAASSLQTRADDLQGQVDKLTNQIAALQAMSVGLGSGPAAAGNPVTAGPVLFPWGYCTWYVATRRAVNWTGNAIDWWWAAARAGRPEGSQPRVGAIQVSRDSIWGHVAYVEAVNGNGSWVVSEMNFNAWGRVDFRTVWPGGTLIGFIY